MSIMPAAAIPTPPGRLVELAPELLELILSFLAPRDLAHFGQTCRRANAFIQPDNQVLWKAAFLHIFDNPRHVWDQLPPSAQATNCHRQPTWDWCREVHRRCRAFNAVCKTSNATLLTSPEHVVTALLDILDTASFTSPTEEGTRTSFNLDFLDRLFTIAPSPERIVHDYHRDFESVSLPFELTRDPDRPITRSMLGQRTSIPEWASRFHIVYGNTEREGESLLSKAAARALVYDWAVTGPEADYGPFVKNNSGLVNWRTVEAISSLMHRIFATSLKQYKITPSGFKNSIPFSLSQNPAVPEDWAGVTGIWVGTYAFLDYRALVHYNFASNLEYPMDLGNYEEACGDLMRLKLELNHDEELFNDHRLQTDLPYCKDLPRLFFSGSSTGQPNHRPSILVRGSACLLPGGRQVRWRLIIRYAGADQWQLEGVQPGGVRSGGIYGLWTHVDHDDHGPMGPFFYAPAEMCNTYM